MDRDKIKYSEELADAIIDIMAEREVVSNEEQLQEWIVSNPHAAEKLMQLSDEQYLQERVKNFKQKDKQQNIELFSKKLRTRTLKKRIRIATSIAAAVLFVSFSIYQFSQPETERIIVEQQQEQVIEEVNTNIPILYTSEGEYELVAEKTDDDIAEPIKITELIHNTKEISEEKEPKYNRMVVPSEYTVKVELSDGTVVMLNANSELYFPDKFVSGERRVELKGEGYFEVTKSTDKFIVAANGVEINVYGTKFNVNAYKPQSVETILVEGSVGVKMNESEKIMKPNELCISDTETGVMTTQNVVVAKYIAWADGVFMMERDSFEELVEKLSKWYGVEFIIENEAVKDISVSTIISKESSLEDAIDMIELLNYDIKFIKTERGYMIR